MGEDDEGTAALMDRDGNAYSQAQPMRLLDSIDVHLAQRADGSGHAVVEPGSGAVLVAGDDAGGTWDKAQQIAAQLGRRRVQAAIDAVGTGSGGVKPVSAQAAAVSAAPSGAPATGSVPSGSWRDLYDQAVRQGSDWETLHHDGGVPDHDAGLKRYQGLQDQLRKALVDPATPDEAHLPLANAGYRLYTGANAAGLAEAKSIPYSAREAITGSVPFSGGASVGPRVTPMPRGGGLLPPTVGNRTAVTVEGLVGEAPSLAGREPQLPVLGSPVKPLTKGDFPDVGTRVGNKQQRHITGHTQWQQDQGGHFATVQHAQDVLDAYHSGEATILGKSRNGFPVVKLDRVGGMNNNRGAGYLNQPTNTFMIKGTKSPSVVPVSPEWGKK